MAINLTNATTITSPDQFGQLAFTLSHGLFWGLVLIAIFIIGVIRFHRQGLDVAVAATSYVCFALSLPLLFLGWVSIAYTVTFIIMAGATSFYIRYTEPSL